VALRQVMDRYKVKGRPLAKAVGVQVETVSRWRTDPSGMTGANLIAARNYLRRYEPGLEVDDLLDSPALESAPSAAVQG